MISPGFRRVVTAAVAVLALVFWATILVLGIIYSFKDDDPAFLASDGMTYLMPALTALVGGVVAATFSLQDPASSTKQVKSLGKVLTASPARARAGGTQKFVASAYVVVYLIAGLFAIVTWIATDANTIEYVRTVAAAWGGIFVGIATAFFK